MSNILVTGARGFAGSHLADLLRQQKRTVTSWGRDTVDLLDRAAVARAIAELRPDAVYHCAGISHVGHSFNHISDTLAVNVLGTHHLLEALRIAKVHARVLIVGSSLVYRQSGHPLSEDDPVGPATPYALSKLAQEMLGRRAIGDDRQSVVFSRSFNHTGPGQDPSFSAPSFARQIAMIEAGIAPPEIAVGNLDVERDLHDVRDTVTAYQAILERGEVGRVYNVCAGQAFKIGDVLNRLLSMSRTAVTVRHDPERYRPNDNPVLVGNRTRIEQELQWTPRIPLDRTLADLLDYWRVRAK